MTDALPCTHLMTEYRPLTNDWCCVRCSLLVKLDEEMPR